MWLAWSSILRLWMRLLLRSRRLSQRLMLPELAFNPVWIWRSFYSPSWEIFPTHRGWLPWRWLQQWRKTERKTNLRSFSTGTVGPHYQFWAEANPSIFWTLESFSSSKSASECCTWKIIWRVSWGIVSPYGTTEVRYGRLYFFNFLCALCVSVIEHLPSGLRDRFTEMREMDLSVQSKFLPRSILPYGTSNLPAFLCLLLSYWSSC